MVAPPNPQASIGLYYPYIQFRNDAWVKLAALYWDKVARIVPPGYPTHDSDTVTRLAGELDFVVDLAPTSALEIDPVCAEFLRLVERHEATLRRRYAVPAGPDPYRPDEVAGGSPERGSPPLQSWPPAQAGIIRQSWPPDYDPADAGRRWTVPPDPSLSPGQDPLLAYIYAEGKMTGELREALVRTNLGRPLPGTGLLGMDPQLAYVYMEALATQMAVQRKLNPLTDDPFDHVASGCDPSRIVAALLPELLPPRLAQPAAEGTERIEAELATIALRSVIPADLEGLAVKKIIDLRRRHPDELTAFQAAVRGVAEGLPDLRSVDDPAALHAHLDAAYRRTLEPQLNDLRRRLRSLRIDTVLGALDLKLEAPRLLVTGMAVAGLGAIHLNPVAIGAGVLVLGLVPVVRRHRTEAAAAIRASPAAYLLHAGEELQPSQLATIVQHQLRRFLPTAPRPDR